jgi:hypothetical protein
MIALPVSAMPLQVARKSKNSLTGTAPAAYTTLPSLLDSVAGNILMELPTATVWPAQIRRSRNRRGGMIVFLLHFKNASGARAQ